MRPAIAARGISSSWNWFCTRTCGAGRPHVWLCHARLVTIFFRDNVKVNTNALVTRSSAIAGRPCEVKACQRLLKLRRKWPLRLNDLQMYFKVIKSGTNRKLVYDFLLVVYSNFCSITPFLRNLMWNSPVTLKYAQGHWQLYHLKAVMWPCM